MPIRDDGVSQLVPIGALASALVLMPHLISRDWYSYLLVGLFLIKGAHDCSVLQIA